MKPETQNKILNVFPGNVPEQNGVRVVFMRGSVFFQVTEECFKQVSVAIVFVLRF